MKINKDYSSKEAISEINDFFYNEGFVQLVNFFEENFLDIKNIILKEKFESFYDPLYAKFNSININKTITSDIIFFVEYFKSKEFISYIEEIFDDELIVKSLSLNIYGYKDFIILNDKKTNMDELIEIYFDLTDSWKNTNGGTVVYLNEREEIFYLEPMYNTLTMIYKPQNVMKYLKYINNKAKDKKIIRIEIELEPYSKTS